MSSFQEINLWPSGYRRFTNNYFNGPFFVVIFCFIGSFGKINLNLNFGRGKPKCQQTLPFVLLMYRKTSKETCGLYLMLRAGLIYIDFGTGKYALA